MKKVDFFIVGEPKSGTTALLSFLSQHPDIYMPDWLEPNYFCSDLYGGVDWRKGKLFFMVRKLVDYKRLFEGADEKALWGEKSVYYLTSKVAAEKIYQYNPKAKIIVMLREPMDFLESLYLSYRLMGIETAGSLMEALKLEKERKKRQKMFGQPSCLELLFYFEMIKYSQHLKRFRKFFDKDSVKVIFYEDFKKDNGVIYKEVLEFLGVDGGFVPKFRLINVRRRFRFEFLSYLVHESVVYRRIMDMIPLRARGWLSPWCDWFFFKKVKGNDLELDETMKRRLNGIIKVEVIQLSKLLGMSVKNKWKRR